MTYEPFYITTQEYGSNILHIQREILREFWDQFGGTRNSGKGYSRAVKMDRVKRLNRYEFIYKKSPLWQKRKQFLARNKFKRYLKGFCFVCGSRPVERHHPWMKEVDYTPTDHDITLKIALS